MQAKMIVRKVRPEDMLIEALAVHHYAMFRGGWMTNQPAVGRLIARQVSALGGAATVLGPSGNRAFGEWISQNILRLLFNAWNWKVRKREDEQRAIDSQLQPFPNNVLHKEDK
jgi:hypothetical protein